MECIIFNLNEFSDTKIDGISLANELSSGLYTRMLFGLVNNGTRLTT